MSTTFGVRIEPAAQKRSPPASAFYEPVTTIVPTMVGCSEQRYS